MTNIAMENHHAIKFGKPSISMGHRNPMAMLVITRGYPLKVRIQFEKTTVCRSYCQRVWDGLSKDVEIPRENCHFKGFMKSPNDIFVGRPQLCYSWLYIPWYPDEIWWNPMHISIKSLFLLVVWPLHGSGLIFFSTAFSPVWAKTSMHHVWDEPSSPQNGSGFFLPSGFFAVGYFRYPLVI